jgi:hypothetical protein
MNQQTMKPKEDQLSLRRMFKALSLICQENPESKEKLREIKFFNPLFDFLKISISKVDEPNTIFGVRVISACLDLFTNCLIENKMNQVYILGNFSCYDLLSLYLN